MCPCEESLDPAPLSFQTLGHAATMCLFHEPSIVASWTSCSTSVENKGGTLSFHAELVNSRNKLLRARNVGVFLVEQTANIAYTRFEKFKENLVSGKEQVICRQFASFSYNYRR